MIAPSSVRRRISDGAGATTTHPCSSSLPRVELTSKREAPIYPPGAAAAEVVWAAPPVGACCEPDGSTSERSGREPRMFDPRMREPAACATPATCVGTRGRQRSVGSNPATSTPQPAREHVQLLQDSMSVKAIAAAAGVSVNTVKTLLAGKGEGAEPSTRLLRTVAEKLLAVPVPPPGTVAPHIRDGQQVDGTGTRRRLRALVAAGHTQSDLDTRLGWPVGSVNRIVNGRTRRVTAGRYRETATLFKELQLVPGHSVQARARALRRRWPLPFQWDEETIDDPQVRAIQCRSQRRAA